MARKLQKLINYHTSGTTMPSSNDVNYGEIVVRHNVDTPELLIKVSEDEFGVFQDSKAVELSISAAVKTVDERIDTEVSGLEDSLKDVRESISGISTNIGDNYVSNDALEDTVETITSSYTTAIGEAKEEVYSSAITAAAASAVTLDEKIDGVQSNVNTLNGNLDTFKTEVANTYETKKNVANAITAAKADVYSSATTAAAADAKAKDDALFTSAMTKVNAVSTEFSGAIDAVNDRVDTVSGNLNTFKAYAAETYETKANVTTAITAAKADVYTSATTAAAADATAKANAAQKAAIDAAAASAVTLDEKIDGVQANVNNLSGNVHTTIANVQTALTKTINDKVAVAYRYAGSCTYAELPASGSVIGEVWNVTDANGNFPAGTNYAWDGDMWDALGGSIDLSPYALKTDLTGNTNTLQNAIDAVNDRVDTVSGNLNTFKTEVAETYETKANVTTAITAAKADVYTSATTAAAADATTKANAAQKAAIDAAVASAKTLDEKIDGVQADVNNLSAATITVKATADSAVQTATVTDGVKVSKNGTELAFDFSEIIIDCGDF